jgi:DNA-binding response OmpR family regulator/DNA-binding CsgD family transcriptional regulator
MKSRDIVLVVDDSPETLSMLTDALEDAGVTVLVALEGDQALSLMEKITPDIILMDAMMPGVDGFETTRRLKKNKNMAHVPVIFMTGLSETEHIVKGLEAGGVDYVTKPIVPSELIARMHVHLANARIAQGTQVALDAAGRFLLAVNRAGRVLWCTPQANKLLNSAFASFDADGFMLPAGVQSWLESRHQPGADATTEAMMLPADSPALKLNLNYVSQIGPDEFLLRLIEGDTGGQEHQLKQRLALTLREAEVLLWIARGKSNRDIGEILGLSPRTVNKHLEHIYDKLGVENRSSAAAVAVRLLGEH